MPLDGNTFKHFITETHHINSLLSNNSPKHTHTHAHTPIKDYEIHTNKHVDVL